MTVIATAMRKKIRRDLYRNLEIIVGKNKDNDMTLED